MGKLEKYLGISGKREFIDQDQINGFVAKEIISWKKIIDKYENEYLDKTYLSYFSQSNESFLYLYENNILFSTETNYWKSIESIESRYYIYSFLSKISSHYNGATIFSKPPNIHSSFFFELTEGYNKALELIRDSEQKSIDNIKSDVESYINDKISQSENNLTGAIISNKFELINLIEGTEKSIRAGIIVNETATYWKTKSRLHRKLFYKYFKYGRCYAIIAFLAVMLLALAIPYAIPDSYNNYYNIFVFGTLLTIIFWVGRVINRLMMSEQHLASSSAEKKAFIETYIALLKEGKMKPHERMVMLQTIFRPASDGIVKEDGVDMANLPNLVAQAIETNKK